MGIVIGKGQTSRPTVIVTQIEFKGARAYAVLRWDGLGDRDARICTDAREVVEFVGALFPELVSGPTEA